MHVDFPLSAIFYCSVCTCMHGIIVPRDMHVITPVYSHIYIAIYDNVDNYMTVLYDKLFKPDESDNCYMRATCNAARWHARLSKQFGATAAVNQLTCMHSPEVGNCARMCYI